MPEEMRYVTCLAITQHIRDGTAGIACMTRREPVPGRTSSHRTGAVRCALWTLRPGLESLRACPPHRCRFIIYFIESPIPHEECAKALPLLPIMRSRAGSEITSTRP